MRKVYSRVNPSSSIVALHSLSSINADPLYDKYLLSSTSSVQRPRDLKINYAFSNPLLFSHFSIAPEKTVFKSDEQMTSFLDELEKKSKFHEIIFDDILQDFQYTAPHISHLEWKRLFDRLKHFCHNRCINTPKEFEKIYEKIFVFDGWSREEITKAARQDKKTTLRFLKEICTTKERRFIASLLTENEKQILQYFLKDHIFTNINERLDEYKELCAKILIKLNQIN